MRYNVYSLYQTGSTIIRCIVFSHHRFVAIMLIGTKRIFLDTGWGMHSLYGCFTPPRPQQSNTMLFPGQKTPRYPPEARLLFRHSDARTQTPLRPQKSALQECEKSLIYQSAYRTQNRTRSPLQVLRKMHTPQLPVLSPQSIIPSRYVHTDKATDKHYAAASASIKALLHPCSDTVHIFSAIPLYSNNYAFFVCCGSLSAHLPHSAARKFPCPSK